MAHLTGKDKGFKIDDNSGSIADISGSINTMSITAGGTVYDDTGMGETQMTKLPGLLTAAVVSVNGWVDSTSESIFAQWAIATSVAVAAKTVSYQISSGRHYTGEMIPNGDGAVEFSGESDGLQAFSANLIATGALTRTSVAAA